MKEKILSIFMLCSCLMAQAQTQITTNSSCDTNTDGDVNIADVTNTTNKVLGKAAAEKNVVTAEQLKTVLSEINSQLDKVSTLDTRLKTMETSLGIGKVNGHEYVDLGITDENGNPVYWATCNVGANRPFETGLYFAWGETKGYGSDTSDGHSFDWANYKWMTAGQSSNMYCTKYTFQDGQTSAVWYSNGTYVGSTVNGVTYKSKTLLDKEDDAASVNWGGEWRMPTRKEIYDLKGNCYWVWTTNYKDSGVSGYIVYKVKDDHDKKKWKNDAWNDEIVGSYSTSDTHIFLPITGSRDNTKLEFVETGYLWSSELGLDSWPLRSFQAEGLYFNSSRVGSNNPNRNEGQPVRAVISPN